jgi:hypothetical protein
MVRYGEAESSLAVSSITGAIVSDSSSATTRPAFRPWQPSTWPDAPATVNEDFIEKLGAIFDVSILGEIDNVIGDAKKANGGLTQRGHVVAIALLCALDAISVYGYGGSDEQIPDFVKAHFPAEYRPYANKLLILYRHNMVHLWNLFRAALLPGNEPIVEKDGVLCFGLMHFRDALHAAVVDFLDKLRTDGALQTKTLQRYGKLRRSAKS